MVEQNRDKEPPKADAPNQSAERSDEEADRAREQPHTAQEPSASAETSEASKADAPHNTDGSLTQEVEAELDKLKGLVAEREGLLKRVQADFENSLKRTEREIERATRAAEMNTVKRLLPLLDTIESGLRSEPEGSDAHKTLSMVEKELMATLGSLGVRKIEAEGVPFDADLHDALMTKQGPEDTVLEVVQQGYRYGDSVLRHAKVIVGNGESR